MEQLPILIPLPLLAASLVVPLAGLWAPRAVFPISVAAVALSAAMSALALAEVVAGGEALRYTLGGWAPPIGIEYVVDHVAAFVTAVITGVALLVVVAARRAAAREAAGRRGLFYALVLLLLAGLTGMVVTGDLFNVFVFMEISSLAAYALVFRGGRAGMLAAYRYLILGTVGGSFYLLGVAFLYFTTGTLNMTDMARLLGEAEPNISVAAGAAFIFAGLGMKMALVPLHLWLPDAYTFAPSSVNSLIAPIMTKVGAYVMVRMFISVFPEGYLADEVPVSQALIALGLAGSVYGAYAAMGQRDLRRMLAYSSVSQLGLLAVGIGIATPLGLAAALLHVMNHALMKGALFLTAMSMRMGAGVSDVRMLAGLGRRMPATSAVFAVGAVAMVGIPPTAGFFSKWYLSIAAIDEGLWFVLAVVLASSLLSAVYLFRVIERLYLAPAPAIAGGADDAPNAAAPAQDAPARESPLDVTLPMALLALATIVLGVLNVVVMERVLEPGL
ncbi:MAG: proton-conducting transporter membrane subunit [Chloroflexota bacterium]|nr:proton-conducting transporter membrane subunit [Chloroflexota bacterium]